MGRRQNHGAAIAVVVLCTIFTGVTCGGDWPQFLGPDRNGQSKETGLARKWPDGGPKVLWTVDLGEGFGGASVADAKVYVLDRVASTKDVLRCLDFATGKELWTFEYNAPGKFSYNGSRSTPTVDDKYVFIVGAMGDFHCVSKTTHKAVWKKHLLKDFDGKRPAWVVSQSPLLYKDMVIAAPQGKKGAIAAFDKVSGELKWKSGPLGGLSYASPMLTTIDGVAQVIMLTDKGPVSGIDADTGEILWTYRGWKWGIPITSPLSIGDGRIFITGEYGAGSAMIKVEKKDGKFTVKELYKTSAIGAQCHQPLLYKGHLYVNSNGNRRRDGLLCSDLDGNVKWKTGRNPNFERGNLILADDLIFMMDGRAATLYLMEPSPEGYNQLDKAKLLEGKGGRRGAVAWGPMALSGGKLILRDQRQMKCVDVRAK